MRYDIVSLNSSYGGVERTLTHDDLLSKKSKKYFDELLPYYFKCIELLDRPYNKNNFDSLTEYFFLFKKYDVNCEMIVYDSAPLKDAFGRRIKLLGIDIVHDMVESLLEDFNNLDDATKKRLNQFGLFENISDADAVVQSDNNGDINWKPCRVYRVIV